MTIFIKKLLYFITLFFIFVTFFNIKANAASINTKSVSIYKGKTVNLKLNGTKIKKVSSSNKKIASVNSKGKVYGKKAGKCNIYLKGTNGIKYTCKVKVINPYLSVKSIKVTQKKSYTLKLYGTNIKSVSSSNEKIATINKKGIIKAIKSGICNVYLKGTNNIIYTCKVKVETPFLNNTNVNLNVGETFDLNLKGTIKPKKWSTLNSEIATINKAGVITAINEGQTIVTVKCDGVNYKCTVNINLKNDILKNKKISFIGDSITTFENYNPEGYATKYALGDVVSVNDTWWYQLYKELGMSLLKNCAWSGSTCIGDSISTTSARAACSTKRILDISNDNIAPDIIICYIGTNDYIRSSPIGNWAKTKYNLVDKKNISTFSEAYAMMLNKIRKNYPNAIIYCCTILPTTYKVSAKTTKNEAGITLSEYNNTIQDVAKYFNIEVIDLTNCGINNSTLKQYTIDLVHPNKAGMKLISKYMQSYIINSYIKYNK